MALRRHPLHSASTCPRPARSHGMRPSPRRCLPKALWGEQGIGSCQSLGHRPTPARAWRKLPSPPSTAQPWLADALSCCTGGRIVFFFLGMGSSSTQTPSVLPRSAPSSPSTREGTAKLEDGGQCRRLGLPAHLLCLAPALPGQLCAAQHAAVVLLNQPERSCTVPVLNPAFESGAGHHLM